MSTHYSSVNGASALRSKRDSACSVEEVRAADSVDGVPPVNTNSGGDDRPSGSTRLERDSTAVEVCERWIPGELFEDRDAFGGVRRIPRDCGGSTERLCQRCLTDSP